MRTPNRSVFQSRIRLIGCDLAKLHRGDRQRPVHPSTATQPARLGPGLRPGKSPSASSRTRALPPASAVGDLAEASGYRRRKRRRPPSTSCRARAGGAKGEAAYPPPPGLPGGGANLVTLTGPPPSVGVLVWFGRPLPFRFGGPPAWPANCVFLPITPSRAPARAKLDGAARNPACGCLLTGRPMRPRYTSPEPWSTSWLGVPAPFPARVAMALPVPPPPPMDSSRRQFYVPVAAASILR